MMFRLATAFLLSLLIVGCSGITPLSQGQRGKKENLYREDFLVKIKNIKGDYRKGKIESALLALKQLNDQGFLPSEKAMRRNLIGVILFGKKEYEQAIYNFDLALSTSRLDNELTSQVYLNLASSYYKLGLMDKSYATIKSINGDDLPLQEKNKYHLLMYEVAKEVGDETGIIVALSNFLDSQKTLDEIKSNSYFKTLQSQFAKLNKSEKVRFIEDFIENNSLTMGYLAYLEVEDLFFKGKKEEAKDLLSWLQRKFSDDKELTPLLSNFDFRSESKFKMDLRSIGVILPLSGDKKDFGKRALLGIDSAYQEILAKNGEENGNLYPTLYFKDSQGGGALGAQRVKELVEQHHVSVIIGGLFPKEATKEYLEAKKRGAFFISLSSINLPKGQKGHMLLEIPGSIESQVNRVFSDDHLLGLGKRGSILYPNSEAGKAYVNEFWRKAQEKGVQITGMLPYNPKRTDFRDPVSNLLGLKFKRERQEELTILSEIHSLKKSRSARRIQNLRPIIDFDWVFIPSMPRDALQIIPSFSYFDAFKLKLIGGPSWRSQALLDEGKKHGSLLFIGEDVQALAGDFKESFMVKYKRNPRLIEIIGHDSLKVADSLIAGKEFQNREQLENYVKEKEYLNGISGNWMLDQGIWIKEMASLKIHRGRIEKAVLETPVTNN